MNSISNIETAVLGLLCEKTMYGYEIEKIIEERNMRNWTEIAFSSVYYVLKKLEDKKLVKGKIKSSKNKPFRKIYTVTEMGRKAMKDKVKELISDFERIICRFDLGMFNLFLLDTDEILDCFERYLKSADETIIFLQNSKQEMEKLGLPDNVIALATRPLAHVRTEKKWIEEYMNQLKNREVVKK